MYLASMIAIIIPICLKGAENLGFPIWKALILSVSVLLLLSYVMCPMFGILLIFGESVATICCWFDSITKDLNGSTCLTRALKDCKLLIGLLKGNADIFSKQLAGLVLLLMLGSIVHFYKGISSLSVTFENNDWIMSMLLCGYIAFGVTMLYAVLIVINITGKVEVRIDTLIDAIVDCKGDFEEKYIAMHYLKSFDGFSALGFFKLKRSLLSSIAVNCITYIIILMQFKLSDP
jgi:hypothetical protein